MNHCKTIAIVNQKGGVGKTTSTVNLGVGLAQAGNRVLLVDDDPQHSLTISLGIRNADDDLDTTLATAMQAEIRDESVPWEEGIIHSGEGVDLLPANIELSGVEMSLFNAMSREQVLKSVLSRVKENYDYILIDCMPSLGLMSVNALVAADSVIIPSAPDFLSTKGLNLLIRTISRVRRQINPKLKIDGILMTMVDGRTNGKWHWFSRKIGGKTALDYLVKVRGCSFLEAMEIIQGKPLPKAIPAPAPKQEPKRLLLPERNNNADAVIRYLKGRGIHDVVIHYCLENDLLFESRKYHSAVFLGYDKGGVPRYGNVRGTVGDYKGELSGSDKHYSFSIPGNSQVSQLPTMLSHCLSKSAFSWARFWRMMLTEISRLRMVARSLSKSSGKATLANSSMTKWTWTGSRPPCSKSAFR